MAYPNVTTGNGICQIKIIACNEFLNQSVSKSEV